MSDPNQTPIKYTRTAGAPPKRSRADVPLPEGVAAVYPSALDAGQRAVAARIAGVSPALVDDLAAGGLPLILAQAESPAMAKAEAAKLGGQLPGVVAVRPASVMPGWMLPAMGGVLALGLLVMAIGFVVSGIAIPIVAFIATLAGLVTVPIAAAGQGTREQARYKEAFHLIRDAAGGGVAPETRAAALLRRSGEVRALLSRSDLPELAIEDLGGTLDALAQDLPKLAQREAAGEDVEATLDELSAALDALRASLEAPQEELGRYSDIAEQLRTQARAVERSAEELGDARRQAARQAQKKLQ
ncbi:MAG: hypothetical protein H6741_02675 [Alphaproteobacteria bacterium]|nr:hypothetical protein [Alphaproteobacteria bacterium]MCB9791609.1 hypothetical protein [Alphaproteobacteria bacterium]